MKTSCTPQKKLAINHEYDCLKNKEQDSLGLQINSENKH